MKKKVQNKYIYICLLLLITSFLVTNIFLSKKYNYVSRYGKDLILITEQVLMKPINYTKEFIKSKQSIKDIQKKYEEFEKEYSNYNSLKVENEELKKENIELQNQLKINSSLNKKLVTNAVVINRNLDYWYNTLTINCGTKNGVKDGDAVLSKGYLIGKVSEAGYISSIVRLLSNNEVNKMSVKILVNDKYIYGLLTGYNNGLYNVEGISEVIDIPANSIVLTTGFGNTYPNGIEVGKVESIETDNFDLTKIVKVKPSLDLNNINYVTIVSKDNNETSN